LLHLLTTAFGTVLTKPDLALCPQLARADIRPKRAASRFDPERTIGGQVCCGAEHGSFFNDVVGYDPLRERSHQQRSSVATRGARAAGNKAADHRLLQRRFGAGY